MSERDPLKGIILRDEILELMYWMAGEGFGSEFKVADLQKFLHYDHVVLAEDLELMVATGLLERTGEAYRLSETGQAEGGRRFADEFGAMLKPGHFECDQPDCECHDPESAGEPCRNLFQAHQSQHND